MMLLSVCSHDDGSFGVIVVTTYWMSHEWESRRAYRRQEEATMLQSDTRHPYGSCIFCRKHEVPFNQNVIVETVVKSVVHGWDLVGAIIHLEERGNVMMRGLCI